MCASVAWAANVAGEMFRLQIVSADTGQLARFPGGGVVECDLIREASALIRDNLLGMFAAGGMREDEFLERIRTAIADRPVGLFATRVDVVAEVDAVVRSILSNHDTGLTKTDQQIHRAVTDGLTAAIMGLKRHTRLLVR